MAKGDEIPRPKKTKRAIFKDPYKKFGTRGQAIALLHFIDECSDRTYDEARYDSRKKQA